MEKEAYGKEAFAQYGAPISPLKYTDMLRKNISPNKGIVNFILIF
jgi:hypothetical protein